MSLIFNNHKKELSSWLANWNYSSTDCETTAQTKPVVGLVFVEHWTLINPR